MYKQAFRSSIIVVALLTLVSCGGGSTGLASNSSTTESTSNNSSNSSNNSSENNTPVDVNAGNGVATVSWTAPTQNTDNSALTDLTGYKVYYGASPSTLNNVINIANPSINTYVISNLTNGITVYFAVVAYNSKGIESYLSNISNKST